MAGSIPLASPTRVRTAVAISKVPEHQASQHSTAKPLPGLPPRPLYHNNW
jgi:hypothetical protein